MKRYLLVLLMAVAALGFVGCGAEDFEAKINWKNESSVATSHAVTDIQWVSISNSPDQTWSDVLADGSPTLSATKTVKLETGKGLCFDSLNGTEEYEIEINGGSLTYVLTDGETETLRITDLTLAK